MSDSTQSRSDFPLADIVVIAGSLLVQIPQDMLRAARDKARHALGMYEATGMLFEPPYLLNAKIDLFRADSAPSRTSNTAPTPRRTTDLAHSGPLAADKPFINTNLTGHQHYRNP